MAEPEGPAALETLLDNVHAAVLAGDHATLLQLTPSIEQGLARLDPIANLDIAQRLQRKAERNAICLQAALRGIRAAHRRVQEVGTARSGFATYDGSGRRAQISNGDGAMTRRF